VIKSLLGDRLDAWIQAAFPFLFRRRVNPNVLTVMGTLVSFAAATAFALGEFAWGGVLMLAGGSFDLVDGVVARHHGVASRFGAFLDATLDRVTDMAVLLGIAMYYAIGGEPGRVLLAGYALSSGVLVSYTKARAELEVRDFRVGLLERGERVGLIAAGALFGFMVAALWIVSIGSTITVFQRFALAYREMERRDALERVGGARVVAEGEHT
jgi:CDP-diacylglycerol--glycerol-3-phosphate 3-phosphatidyltransferase